jgi:DUF971 family protein
MRAADIQRIGNELAVKWEDGSESYVALEMLRRACPCAGCKGEIDVMGNLHRGPEQKLTTAAFDLKMLVPVGTYGFQPTWGDGHATGIFTYDYLRRVIEIANR